jgi:hypothetical protein
VRAEPHAGGTAERRAALAMIERASPGSTKGYLSMELLKDHQTRNATA